MFQKHDRVTFAGIMHIRGEFIMNFTDDGSAAILSDHSIRSVDQLKLWEDPVEINSIGYDYNDTMTDYQRHSRSYNDYA